MKFDRMQKSTNASTAIVLAFLAVASISVVVDSFLPTTLRSHHVASNFQTKEERKRFINGKVVSPARFPFSVCPAKSSSDGTEDEDDEVMLQDEDWRAFRAKLVMGEQKSKTDGPTASATAIPPSLGSDNARSNSKTATDDNTIVTDDGDLDGIGSLFRDEFPKETIKTAQASSEEGLWGMTPLDPSHWAYDSGDVIEKGAVILGGVEQEFGFGLRQQYFHKAAILVLDHSDTFTKGIILNRPTDLTLEDDINPGVKWRVWFGGDVEGLHASHPDIVCLHSLKNEKAAKASIPVMKDIQWTTFDNAKKLVKSGVARVSDFWVFVGYAGWGPGQLAGELTRNSWYMVATDSGTLLKELGRQSEGADPRDAGLDTWSLLMNMIGRSDTARENTGGFDDLMLKEWAFTNLLSTAAGGGAGRQQRDPVEFNTNPELVEQMLSMLESRSESMEGALVRASALERSPFLLENQMLHKSVVLIIKDDKLATIGVILNRPSTQGLDIKVDNKESGQKKNERIPMIYGGPFSVQGGEQSVLWLHCDRVLRDANIGSPVGAAGSHGIRMCTTQEVMKAVGSGLVTGDKFLAVIGVFVWVKDNGAKQGIEGELELGHFEEIPDSAVDDVWSVLKKQQVLTPLNLDAALRLSEDAWIAAGKGKEKKNENKKNGWNPFAGLGENFDEEDDSLVFKSNYKVSQLSDDSLRNWCMVFLLGIANYIS
ncbi:ACR COG1678 domain containing protein [Nitzschia inconspicua]|uniref:ACR COG1678 domain containing protein n=1 Tax=Nitzschia inconspicua TaxID=303405 RepID=A0A9K3LGG9_9STRA|nr:ACR COG1678 domain containing protein [Nitzschia inconspicua]